MNLDGGRAKEGRLQYKWHRSVLFNLDAGEPKGRDVSEGLIGSDTIVKLSGLCRVLSSITSKECRNVKARGEKKKYLMIETFFLLTEHLAEN